ncbi:hypothetical protein LO763_22605 [Glycomyces sp. A-F 0318]|uniref:hypothetical protein n=1 Tax=Glycomyces amatae TaxID=2881355 RepID=UPI001E583CFD|nr:hypothetical protein [Glycomyces amatae]MCD0446411.1 hypothetical protein [Glycomyces amatae]
MSTTAFRVTFRIDRALWQAYRDAAASAERDPTGVLVAVLTAWAEAAPLPHRPTPPPIAIAWGRGRNVTVTVDPDWWSAFADVTEDAGYTRAAVIDRACRWWLGIDTLPHSPAPTSG